MPLAAGSRLAHYEILDSLGAGGMGEVYRASDTKLSRQVALKILPDAFSSDPERRARFAREAKSLAALNHPHIAQIYGFEDGQTSALVMELVDGEDLSQRIKRGPIPFDEAIAIAKQIAQALAAAHDQGIIHRDLKPANIKLREDGTIKVLDFGLAKALETGSGVKQGSSELSMSPTITSPANVTAGGVILGTAAYMAPEQAKGRFVDKRADIWAFGCVLYEMLTGRKAFAGDDVSDTLASILKSDVDYTGVPPRAIRLLKRCLEKDPKQRLHDIADAWDLVDDGAPPSTAQPSAPRNWMPWAIAALFLLSTAALLASRFLEPVVTPDTVRFQILPPQKYRFDIYVGLSPDGRRMAFTAVNADGIPSIWVRDLERLESRQLTGTEQAWSPFWSPDGKFIAFGQDRYLKKIDLSGGPPQTITEVPGASPGMGAWGKDGTIVFGARGSGPIRKVSATGGTISDVTAIDGSHQETTHAFPIFLPDGKRFLYWRGSTRTEYSGVYLASIDKTPDQQDKRIITAATLGPIGVVRGPSGHQMLVCRDGVVLAQPFDVDSATASGDVVTIADHVGSSGSFAFFGTGGDNFVYRTGTATSISNSQLTWVNRKGETIRAVGEPMTIAASANAVAVSPAGDQAAIMRLPATIQPDIWTVEFARGIATRITFDESADVGPVWASDGSRLAFRSGTARVFDIFTKNLNSADEAAPLSPDKDKKTRGVPSDWSKDGRFLLFTRGTAERASDLLAFDIKGKSEVMLLSTTFEERDAHLSPDGRTLAYESNESGAFEIYFRPFVVSADGKPALGPKWRVSTAGGSSPRWRADGKELFFRGATGEVMAADVLTRNGAVQSDLPHKLFTMNGATAWDAAGDGQRFLMSIPVTLRADTEVPIDPLTIVLNWQSALRK